MKIEPGKYYTCLLSKHNELKRIALAVEAVHEGEKQIWMKYLDSNLMFQFDKSHINQYELYTDKVIQLDK